MKYLTISRRIVLLLAVVAAVPPMLMLGVQQAFTKKPAKDSPPVVAHAAAPSSPEAPVEWPGEALPEDFRLEVPRTPRALLPVRWSSTLTEASSPERWGLLKNRALSLVLADKAKVLEVREVTKPFGPGLAIVCRPESKVAPGVESGFRIVLYTVLPEPDRTAALQLYADGKYLPDVDLIKAGALPFRVQTAGVREPTIYAVAASNVDLFSRAWDWTVESAKVKKEFAARILASKTPEEDAQIREEMKKKQAEGYDIK